MIFQLQASQRFPLGTVVSAYLHDSDLDGLPSGDIVDQQTMGDDLVFKHLEEGRSYWAVGTVGGQTRRELFYVNEPLEFDPDPMDLREFALGGEVDFQGQSDVLPTVNEAIDYLNGGPGRAVAWPIGTYLLDGELDDITGGRANMFTFGAGVTKLIKAQGITTGRFWNITGSSASVNIGGFSYFYGGTTDGTGLGPTDKECAVRFGDTAQGVVGDSQINGGAGMVEFSGDSSGCIMGMIKGNLDWSLGGWMIKNLGCASARVNGSQINGKFNTSGANAGGGMLLIKPSVGDSSDGGTYTFCYAQGPNCEGPDWGFKIDATDAAAINNQRIVSPTWDHCYRYEWEIVALAGSNCRMRNIQIMNPRCSGDGPAHYKIDWQSSQIADIVIDNQPRLTFRAVKRPFFFSSAPNTLAVRVRDPNLASRDAIAANKRLFNLACGRWRISNLTAGTGADPTPSYIEAGGEALPYEVRVLIVDAKGGTYTGTKAGGSTTAGLAPTATAATLQTAFQAAGLYGAGNVIVEGGPGGIFGPLRTRLAQPYTIGDATMFLQDASVAVAPPGPCKIGGGGAGGSGNIAYTGISGNTLTGCTGGSGGPFTGATTVTFPTDDDPDDDTEGNGAVYYLIFKGIYAPTATTAPGYGATPAIPALTLDGTNLTGSGEVGGGKKLALIDTISHACPLNNYGDPGRPHWGRADIEKSNVDAPDFIDYVGYTA